MSLIRGIRNKFQTGQTVADLQAFAPQIVEKIYHFHQTIPGYEETPLRALDGLAKYLGISNIYVKDEGYRFNLNAFKGLGVSYAVADYYAKELKLDIAEITFDELLGKAKEMPKVTFATATDGNHGKGLAWAAQLFGQQAKVFMPKGSSLARLNAIKSFGADAEITEMNYDDTVSMVAEKAEKKGWIVVQDTAWEGYKEIPLAIMQGYATIIAEVQNQLSKDKFNEITHVFLQAGVGSFAGAMAATIANLTVGAKPYIFIVEPDKANPLYASAQTEDGYPKRVYGDLDTMMAGLACGEPNPTAWELLKLLVEGFYSCDDEVSAKGMRVLGNPIEEDERVIGGESGAVPLGFVYEVLTNVENQAIKEELRMDENAKVLVINTEGDTDPANYRHVVWN